MSVNTEAVICGALTGLLFYGIGKAVQALLAVL